MHHGRYSVHVNGFGSFQHPDKPSPLRLLQPSSQYMRRAIKLQDVAVE